MLPRERMKQSSPVAAVPLILLIAAAAIEQLRLVAMLLLLLGLVVLLLRRWQAGGTGHGAVHGAVLPFAACLLVSVNLVWDSLGLPVSLPGGASCADALSPLAVSRALGALVVLTCLALIMRLIRAAPWEIGLRWPSRAWVLISLAALPALGTAAALIGPPLAEPFFGPVASATPDLRALAPGLLFAVANSSMEEAVYRGVLLRWLTPAFGLASAMALQAIAFGLAHGTGTDFIGSPLPVMAATAATGLLLGLLAVRSGSLLAPIAIHIAMDIPVYYGKVCLGT